MFWWHHRSVESHNSQKILKKINAWNLISLKWTFTSFWCLKIVTQSESFIFLNKIIIWDKIYLEENSEESQLLHTILVFLQIASSLIITVFYLGLLTSYLNISLTYKNSVLLHCEDNIQRELQNMHLWQIWPRFSRKNKYF